MALSDPISVFQMNQLKIALHDMEQRAISAESKLDSANAAIEVLQRAEQSAVSEADSMRSRLQKALGLLRTALLYNQGRRETWIDEANALVVERPVSK
jgi:hypothetical protein